MSQLSLTALLGAVELGVIFALVALGVYLTFRILDFPDLTVDGSFVTGGATAATMIVAGYSPFLATGVAVIIGSLAGIITGLLHTKGKINPLLSGILSMIGLYSINIRIMGGAAVPLTGENTVFLQVYNFFERYIPFAADYSILIVMTVLVMMIKFGADWFLGTEIGLALRATGDNARMIRSFAANTDNMKIIGLALSNGLFGLAGALFSQYNASADITMGIGMIITGLASVIIGEAIFGHTTVRRATLAVIGGAVLYRIFIAFALRYGLEPSDVKLVTALIVVVALILPRIIGSWRDKQRLSKNHRLGMAGGDKSAEAKRN